MEIPGIAKRLVANKALTPAAMELIIIEAAKKSKPLVSFIIEEIK